MIEAEATREEVEDLKDNQEEETSTQEEETASDDEETSEQETSSSGSEKTEKSKEFKSLLAQKEHYRKKYSEALKQLEELRKSDKVSDDMPTTTDPLKVVKLAKALEGYSEEEVDFIIRNAPDKTPEGIIKASSDEWVRTAIEARREKVAKSNKTPAPSSPEVSLGGKTPEEIAKMDEKEFAEWLKKNPPIKGEGQRI